MIRNLQSENIYRDYGKISIKFIEELERIQNVFLPKLYVNFIIKHNGARLDADTFDFEDPNYPIKNRDSIAFCRAEKILYIIETLKLDEDPDWDDMYKFEDGLIPFGDNGGGDMIFLRFISSTLIVSSQKTCSSTSFVFSK